MDEFNVPVIKPGDPIRAAWLNEVAELATRSARQINALPRPPSAPGETLLWPDTFAAMIVATGPNSESDYTDARYFIKRLSALPPASASDDSTVNCGVSEIPGEELHTTATNLAELTLDENGQPNDAGTHNLSAGTPVRVWVMFLQTDPPTKYYVFAHGVGAAVVVKITGNASGGGKYLGRICSGNSTAIDTGNLSMPEGLTVPAADNALILNMVENGLSTHALATNTFHVGTIRGVVPGGTHQGKTIITIAAFGVGCP